MRESASKLDFILYLEGVPTPMISATINISIGVPSSASIAIPPTTKSQEILERTSVHLFYADSTEIYSEESPKEFAKNTVYKLLFEGEVVALEFHKQDDSRSTVLLCEDHSNNFDYAHKFVIQDMPDIANAPIMEALVGSGQSNVLTQDFSNLLHSPIANLVSKQNNLAEGVKRLIEAVFKGDSNDIRQNEFLLSVENRFKISDRILFYQDDDLENLVPVKAMFQLLSRDVGRNPSSMKLSEMINSYLDFGYYNRISLSPPPFIDNKIKSVYLAPQIFFSPPPKCNIIFPDRIRNMGYRDDFLRTPTRLLMGTSPFGRPNKMDGVLAASSTYIAPREISALLPTGANQPNIIHKLITSEERRKGVIPFTKVIGTDEYNTLLGQRRTLDDRSYLLEKAEYELELRRAATRNIDSMSGPFNPEVIVGLPGVVLDEIMFIFGMISSVMHRIDAESGASTTYSLRLTRKTINKFSIPQLEDKSLGDKANDLLEACKIDLWAGNFDDDEDLQNISSIANRLLSNLVEQNADVRIIDIVRKMSGPMTGATRKSLDLQYVALMEDGVYENIPENNKWVNSNYDFDKAGNTYKELFGCGSLVDDFATSTAIKSFGTMSEAARYFLNKHRSEEDPYSFTRSFTKRSNITTQLDFDNFYGLEHTRNNLQPYKASGPFTGERQKVILEYVRELSARAHLG